MSDVKPSWDWLKEVEQQLAKARREAWEAAAKLCDAKARYYKSIQGRGQVHDTIARYCAKAIRAQAAKEKP